MMKQEKASQQSCYRCGKVIKGMMVYVVPPLIAVMCGDFEKAFHPSCHEKSEQDEADELYGK